MDSFCARTVLRIRSASLACKKGRDRIAELADRVCVAASTAADDLRIRHGGRKITEFVIDRIILGRSLQLIGVKRDKLRGVFEARRLG